MPLDDGHEFGLQLLSTDGVHQATTVQFAEGHWPGIIGAGVALNDRAFDVVEPSLVAVCSAWTPHHRYGVFDLSLTEATALVGHLRSEAGRMPDVGEPGGASALLISLAAWLEPRCDGRPLSVLGY